MFYRKLFGIKLKIVCKFAQNKRIYREKYCQMGSKSDIIRNNSDVWGENE